MKFFEKHKKRKILGIIILLILLVIFWIYGSIIATLREGTVAVVEKEEIDEETLLSENVPIIKEEQKEDYVFNVLLIGADSRDPEDRKSVV